MTSLISAPIVWLFELLLLLYGWFVVLPLDPKAGRMLVAGNGISLVGMLLVGLGQLGLIGLAVGGSSLIDAVVDEPVAWVAAGTLFLLPGVLHGVALAMTGASLLLLARRLDGEELPDTWAEPGR